MLKCICFYLCWPPCSVLPVPSEHAFWTATDHLWEFYYTHDSDASLKLFGDFCQMYYVGFKEPYSRSMLSSFGCVSQMWLAFRSLSKKAGYTLPFGTIESHRGSVSFSKGIWFLQLAYFGYAGWHSIQNADTQTHTVLDLNGGFVHQF